MSGSEVDKKRSLLWSLFMECPLTQAIAPCPFHSDRARPLKERFISHKEIPDEQLNELIELHRECFTKRIRALIHNP